jgi:predicted dehydrogenase
MKYAVHGKCRIVALLLICFVHAAFAQKKLNVCIAGLSHDHVTHTLDDYRNGKLNIIGIAEADRYLREKYRNQYHLADTLFFTDLAKMLAVKQPDVVLAYNPVAQHLDVVKVCAPLGILVMVERPLAANLAQVQKMEDLQEKYHNRILTNYETTWYPSYQELYNTINRDSIGSIQKIMMHAGSQGPAEAGGSKQYLSWLTNAEMNGAGALTDYGCYGIDLMTWFMRGLKPVAITAVIRHRKPGLYPNVDDEASIILEYPGVTGTIEASWDLSSPVNTMEVYGQKGSLFASDNMHISTVNHTSSNRLAPPLKAPYQDEASYITAVLQNKVANDDRSSMRYNTIVMEILEAAKRSAKVHRRIAL